MTQASSSPASPLRIALVSHTNAAWTEPYAEAISRAGHEIKIFSFSSDPLPGHQVIHLVQGDDPTTGLLGWWGRSRRLRPLLREFNPHVVFAPYISSNGMAAALAWRGPLVVSARGGDILRQAGYLPAGRLNGSLIRWVCRKALAVHSVSDELTKRLRACGVPVEKIHTFPLGVDLRRFPAPADRRTTHAPLRIVCTRRQEAVYNNETLVAALALLNRNGTPFAATLAGGGPLLSSRRKQVRDLGLAAQICLPGETSATEIASLLQEADVYVSAATSDGTSSSLLEALACGAFPVVSDITANRDWVDPGCTGLLFRPGDAADLARELARALEEVALRSSAAPLNRARVARDGARDQLCNRLLDILEEAAAPAG